ncbi:MAG: hypothetical protein EBZ50_04950 [Alphaproteobacteria bacterium]|nr:hypothetical protein [Alphaproteobacteria bacterium]
MNILAKLSGVVAIAALSAGCAMFESDRPMYLASNGVPVYGSAPALIRWTMLEKDADPKSARIDASFAAGRYVMSARGKDKTRWVESLHVTAAIPPPAATGSPASAATAWYVQQIEYAGDDNANPATYYYDLVRADSAGLWAYQFRCSDLSKEERDAFDMTPPPAPPNPDGTPAPASSACTVRSPESLDKAFALLASRQDPRVRISVKPKSKSWFSRF